MLIRARTDNEIPTDYRCLHLTGAFRVSQGEVYIHTRTKYLFIDLGGYRASARKDEGNGFTPALGDNAESYFSG